MNKNFFKQFFKIAGSSILISMACWDPGNLAGDMSLAYNLKFKSIWILLLSHIILYFYQDCILRVSTILGKDLSRIIKMLYPKNISILIWISTEFALISADIQGIIGATISLNELFQINQFIAVIIIIVVAILILYIQEFGQQIFESVFLIMLLSMGIVFSILFFNINISYKEMAFGFVPSFSNLNFYSIISIIGATIVPQNLFLQSGLIYTKRKENIDPKMKLFIYRIETFIIIFISFLINLIICSIFTMSKTELDLNTAGDFFQNNLNHFSKVLYFLGLLSSGLSSTSSGALCGQIILNGFWDLNISRQSRNLITRTITVIPCLLVLYFLNINNILNILNLIQFVQLPFSIIPILKIWKNEKFRQKDNMSNYLYFTIIFLTILIQIFYLSGFIQIISNKGFFEQIILIILLVIYYMFIFYLILYNQMNINEEIDPLIAKDIKNPIENKIIN